jgi:hypothetical protein
MVLEAPCHCHSKRNERRRNALVKARRSMMSKLNLLGGEHCEIVFSEVSPSGIALKKNLAIVWLSRCRAIYVLVAWQRNFTTHSLRVSEYEYLCW